MATTADAGYSESTCRAAVGPSRADYYAPKFVRFDSLPDSSRVSWNWPSFFVTFFWMLYRRMWIPAVLYFFVLPIILWIISFLLVFVLGPALGGGVYLLLAIGVWIATGLYGNALYHAAVKRRIADLQHTGIGPEEVIRRLQEQKPTANAVVIVAIALFFGIFILGILAAISIPAYQDYTIRAQVTEGLNLAAPYKAGVAEYYSREGTWPAGSEEAGLGARQTSGKYVEEVSVDKGLITITFGGDAHSQIRGETLTLRPTVTAGDDVRWSCGYAADEGDDPDSGGAPESNTTVPRKYLPSMCRGN